MRNTSHLASQMFSKTHLGQYMSASVHQARSLGGEELGWEDGSHDLLESLRVLRPRPGVNLHTALIEIMQCFTAGNGCFDNLKESCGDVPGDHE